MGPNKILIKMYFKLLANLRLNFYSGLIDFGLENVKINKNEPRGVCLRNK
jgi:hypothetical protein